MRILLVQNMIYVPTHGGASKANRLLLEGLAAKGHSCRAVVPAFGAQVSVKTHAQFRAEIDARGIRLTSTSSGADVFRYNGVEVHAVTDSSRLHDYVVSQIREFEPTWTLVSNDDPGQLMLEAALEASPSQIVYVVHTPQALPFGPRGFLQDQAKTDLVRRTAGIITESNHVKEYIKQWSRLDSVAIPFPIYGPGPFPSLGCFDDGYVTLINPCAVKGISIFLELARRMPDVQFAGVPTWGTTKADRAALERLPNVRLLPPVDNVEEIYKQTRVLLMPSLWTEAFPLTVREAMLHGIPVIGSNSGGLPETKLGIDYIIPVRLIDQYENRFDELGNPVPVVPEQNIDPWEETLRRLLSDRALYDRLSAASREAAMKFVSGISVEPFEDYLGRLEPAPQVRHGGASTLAKHQDAETDDLRSTLSNLSPERLELLARRLKKRGEDVPKVKKTITPRGKTDSVPLSFAQERLWVLDQVEPGNFAYNNMDVFRLTGRLDVTVLEQSFNEIIRRHEALRTTFPSVDGQPAQVIAKSATLAMSISDLGELPEAAREAEVQRLVIEEAQRPFDLARGPLVRASLLRLEDEEHVLMLTMHHIVSDGWSFGVVIRELTALYEAFSAGRPSSPLPELTIQYADHALWQREWLRGEVLEKQLAYWRRQLSGAPAALELPTDRPRPAVQGYRGAKQSVVLPKSLSVELKALSQREGVTLFMTLLTALKTLLYRYTGQDDIVVGSPIAGRTQAETEGLIGFFANTLVLRADLSGDPTFRGALGRVREVALGAYAHQDLPFEKLVEELQPERSLSLNPLFQVLFVMQNAPRQALELKGLRLRPLEFDSGTAKFDLTLDVVEKADGVSCLLEYNTDLFDAPTIKRMLGHFQVLLEGVVADPEQRISTLPLLTDRERHQLLVEWNGTATDYPRGASLHELFQAQVERTPDAVAVVFEDQQLTYAELNARANQLARYLRKLGVRSEVCAGICAERSLEMVIGLLGILKAGGAYVPLDPAYPKERLSFMLEDSQVPVLLTQAGLVETLPRHGAEVVRLDTDWEVIGQESKENLEGGAGAENLAYVIYTSGSTGKPKGAMNTHLGICNRLLWMQDAYQLTEADRVLQKTPFSFDVSVWEFFWPLLTGARLVVARPEGHRDSAYLVEVIAAQQITTLHFVPSMLQAFLEEQRLDTCTGLRRVICSGEALPFDLQQRFYTRLTAELHNLYGPTEASVDVTFWACARGSDHQIVPIGRPIANTQIYLLDRHLRPVPVGVPGELHIGGVGLARGYLNRPELTAERFIANPFGDEPGARLYKTGDLARYLPDGNIEYLGRIDNQVKVRGFRIELGEIEAVLAEHPAVREAVVVAREDVPGRKRLVAYLVPDQQHAFTTRRLPRFESGLPSEIIGEAPPESAPTWSSPNLSIDDLRGMLKEKLPEYMMPSAFVPLEKLPLLPNGKVDRRALPAPDRPTSELEATFVAPRTPAEETLAGIWCRVLGLERVSIHDNFFELGGDSILGIQIIARANQVGLLLTPKQLFQYQSVAELAAAAGTTSTIQAEQGVVTGDVHLTPIQHWFFEQDLPEPHHFNQAMLLEVRHALNPALLERVVRHLLIHHDALRLRFVRGESGWRQINAGPEEIVPFTRVDLSEMPEAEQAAAIEASATELQASLNLAEGPMMRVALFDMGPQKAGRLLLVIHHLVVDGVSWRILLEDFEAAHQQLKSNDPVVLPRKTTSFKEWAEQLTKYAQSGALQLEADYWLAEPRARISRLPIDYAGGANTRASARTVSVSLGVEETRALLQEVPAAYRTQINDALLTAFVQAFAKWSGESRLLVDLEGHGREEIIEGVSPSRTVGWFTTVFPVLLELGETFDPGNALKSIKEQLRGIPNRGIGYGLLRYVSGNADIAEKLRALPQAEVSFNYWGQFDQTLPESSPFRLVTESSGPVCSLRGRRTYLLDINGIITGGRLQIDCTYSENIHRRTTIEELAREFVEALRSLIIHCQSSEAGSYTPSDFPDVELDQEKLEMVLAEINFGSTEDA